MPLSIEKTKNKLFIMVGKNGPYETKESRLFTSSKNYLIGCLREFFSNNIRVEFNKTDATNESKMLPVCPQRCDEGLCNGGLCKDTWAGAMCDCGLTEYNGLYCNRSLIGYKGKVNNSYYKDSGAIGAYLKLTWKQMLYKKYCLLEIMNGNISLVISQFMNRLIFNSSVIGNLTVDGTNFISVNIGNNRLIIKSRNELFNREFSANDDLRINVGYSERDTLCQTFEGAYDLIFHSLKAEAKSTVMSKMPMQLHLNSIGPVTTSNTRHYQTVARIVLLTVGLLAISITIIIITYVTLNQRMMNKIKSLSAAFVESTGQGQTVLTDIGVYGLVSDENNYEELL